jgi:hypothetical protein
LTTTIREIPTEVVLYPELDGVLESCVVNLDNIQTFQKSKIGGLITTLGRVGLRPLNKRFVLLWVWMIITPSLSEGRMAGKSAVYLAPLPFRLAQNGWIQNGPTG